MGEATAPITREQERLFQIGAAPDGSPAIRPRRVALGNLIADAQLAATDDEQDAVAAFMNPGGVRADIVAGPVTYEEAFTVQPFNNLLTTLNLTGNARCSACSSSSLSWAARSVPPPASPTR